MKAVSRRTTTPFALLVSAAGFLFFGGLCGLPAAAAEGKTPAPPSGGRLGGGGDGGKAGGEEAPAPETLKKVLRLLRQTTAADGKTREKAWKDLRDMGDLAIPAFIALYRRKQVPADLLPTFLAALSDTKDPRAAPLCALLLGHKEVSVRQAAARALADRATVKELPVLRRHLTKKDEPDEMVRHFAAAAAARLGVAEGRAALLKQCASSSGATRSLAVFRLGKYTPPESAAKELLPTLADLLKKDEDSGVRLDVVGALTTLVERSKSAAPPKEQGKDIKQWNAARKATLRAITAVLVRAMDDRNYKVRAAAAAALATATGKKFDEDRAAWKKWWREEEAKRKAAVK